MTFSPFCPVRPARPTRVALTCVLVLLVGLGTAQARDHKYKDDDHDHVRAHSAVQAGEVMPLEQVLAHLGKDHPGQVLKIELEREDGLWTYEVKLLRTDGQLVKLLLDARTAEVLRARRRH